MSHSRTYSTKHVSHKWDELLKQAFDNAEFFLEEMGKDGVLAHNDEKTAMIPFHVPSKRVMTSILKRNGLAFEAQ